MICKIAICIFLLVVGNTSAAAASDNCLSNNVTAQQRLDACAATLQNPDTSRSNKAYAWLRRGYALRALGKPEQAIAEFDQALGLYPNYTEAHLGRGLALTDANRLNDAEQALTTSLKTNPDLAEAFNNRGIVRGRLSKLEQAIEDYTQAIRLKSGFSNAFNNRGTVYYEQNLFQRALVDFDEAIRIAPNRGDILYNRAVTYAALGKNRRAIREFNTILEISPNYARAYFNRGEIHERLGDFTATTKDWKKALELEPDLPVPSSVRKAIGNQEPKKNAAKRKANNEASTGASKKANNKASVNAPVTDNAGTEIIAKAVTLPKPAQVVTTNNNAQTRKKVALIIGNGGYEHVQSLKNPIKDAQAIAQTLESVGFTIHALVLDNGRNEMLKSLQTFSAAARTADIAIVFFAGHGLEIDGNNFMIPVDAKLAHQADLAFEAIELEQILAVVEEASQLGVVILDACRDNPFIGSMELTNATRSLTRGLRPIEPRCGVLVAYAAKHGTVALDGKQQHSPYTQALLDHISTDDLDISLMFRRVSDQVWKATGGRQLPYIYGSLPGDVVALVNSNEK